MKIRNVVVCWILILGMAGCQYDQQFQLSCGGGDPTTELPWLKEISEEQADFAQYTRVKRFQFQEEEFFVLLSCDPGCFCPPMIYTCPGAFIPFDDLRQDSLQQAWREGGEWIQCGMDCSCE